jgi:hypothetical protein
MGRLFNHLYKGTPTCELRDNVGNTGLLAADLGIYLGYVDLPGLSDLGGFSEAIAVPNPLMNLPFHFSLPGSSKDLYGVVVLLDAETNEAANMTLTIELEVEQY